MNKANEEIIGLKQKAKKSKKSKKDSEESEFKEHSKWDSFMWIFIGLFPVDSKQTIEIFYFKAKNYSKPKYVSIYLAIQESYHIAYCIYCY